MNRISKLFAIASIGLAVTLAGCEPSMPNSTQVEQKATEDNQQRLITAQPPPQLRTSAERKNLIERLNRLNSENMTGYIYLVSQTGTVIAFYPVKGKVTSLNSYLSGNEKKVECDVGEFWGDCFVESPDFDGAYGQNTDGIFFFTADTNAYVEWKGEYLWSDQPLKLSTQPMLVREVK